MPIICRQPWFSITSIQITSGPDFCYLDVLLFLWISLLWFHGASLVHYFFFLFVFFLFFTFTMWIPVFLPTQYFIPYFIHFNQPGVWWNYPVLQCTHVWYTARNTQQLQRSLATEYCMTLEYMNPCNQSNEM